MKIIVFAIILGLNLSNIYGQNQSYSLTEIDSIFIYSDMPTNSKLLFLENCKNAKTVAINDIRDNKIKVLIVGGIGPIEYTTDKYFEDKYEIVFYDYGDLPAKYDCMKYYNFEIFEYLTDKYGKKWRKEIRKDVFALKEWKKVIRKKRKSK